MADLRYKSESAKAQPPAPVCEVVPHRRTKSESEMDKMKEALQCPDFNYMNHSGCNSDGGFNIGNLRRNGWERLGHNHQAEQARDKIVVQEMNPRVSTELVIHETWKPFAGPSLSELVVGWSFKPPLGFATVDILGTSMRFPLRIGSTGENLLRKVQSVLPFVEGFQATGNEELRDANQQPLSLQTSLATSSHFYFR